MKRKCIDVGPEGSDGGGYPINEIDDFRDSVLNILNENQEKSVKENKDKDSTNLIEDRAEVDSEEDIIGGFI